MWNTLNVLRIILRIAIFILSYIFMCERRTTVSVHISLFIGRCFVLFFERKWIKPEFCWSFVFFLCRNRNLRFLLFQISFILFCKSIEMNWIFVLRLYFNRRLEQIWLNQMITNKMNILTVDNFSYLDWYF